CWSRRRRRRAQACRKWPHTTRRSTRPSACGGDRRTWYGAISDTLARGGNVIIPTFALERAQELLWMLNQGIKKSRLMPSMQVFLDSPMAISATEIAMGESRKTCIDGINRLFLIPWLSIQRSSCARSRANVGMMTLPPRASVSEMAPYHVRRSPPQADGRVDRRVVWGHFRHACARRRRRRDQQ